jgi:hypothetical protein
MNVFHLPCARLYIHTWTSAAASTYACEHTHARAHRRRRRAQVPHRTAPHRTEPRNSAPAAVARRRPKAAHTISNVRTRAVFHAPMFALNAVADLNAYKPNRTRSTADVKALARFRYAHACAQAHAGARSHMDAHVCKHVAQARIDDPLIIHEAIRMDMDTCTYRVHKYHTCVCVASMAS